MSHAKREQNGLLRENIGMQLASELTIARCVVTTYFDQMQSLPATVDGQAFLKRNVIQVSFTKMIILITWNVSKYCAAVAAHTLDTSSMMAPSPQANVIA